MQEVRYFGKITSMKGKALILGGNGFLGSNIADALVDKGYKVSVFDSFIDSSKLKHDNDIEKIKGDFVRDDKKIKKALKGADFLFHYLATTNPGSSAKLGVLFDAETNLIPTLKLLEYAVKNGVKKIIFPSSGGAVYGKVTKVPVLESHPLNPQSPYSVHKAAIEKYLYFYNYYHGLDYIAFRIANAYGPGQDPKGGIGFINVSLGKILNGQNPVIFGDGSIVRDYIYIDDIVEANILAIEKRTDEKILNLGTGTGRSLNEIIREMGKVLKKDIQPEYVEARKVDVKKVYLDVSKVKKELGWKPKVGLSDGIRKTSEWIKEYLG